MSESAQSGVSIRAYARHAGIRHSYVQKLIREGKLPVNADGSLDVATCDAARHRNTLAGTGQRKYQRRHPESTAVNPELFLQIRERHTCLACQESYPEWTARDCDSPEPQRFCSLYCALDYQDGYTVEQIKRRQDREHLTTCKGHSAARGGDPPGTLQLMEAGLITEQMLDGITDEALRELVRDLRRKRRSKRCAS